jgi:hypothetical protein
MKKTKAFLSLVLVIIIAIGGSGCMNNKFDLFKSESEIQAEKAEELLYKKYGKEFVVDSLGGRWGTATDMFYTCACHPADDENFIFKATIAKDFSTLNDDYSKIIVQRNLTEGLEKELSDIGISASVFVEFHSDIGIEKETMDLDYKEFLRLSFAPIIYAVIEVTDDCSEKVEHKINELFSDYPRSVDVRFYVVSESQKQEFDDWKKEHIYWNDGLKEILPKEVDRRININRE